MTGRPSRACFHQGAPEPLPVEVAEPLLALFPHLPRWRRPGRSLTPEDEQQLRWALAAPLDVAWQAQVATLTDAHRAANARYRERHLEQERAAARVRAARSRARRTEERAA